MDSKYLNSLTFSISVLFVWHFISLVISLWAACSLSSVVSKQYSHYETSSRAYCWGSKKSVWRARIGLIWRSIRVSGGLLWTRQWTFGFLKIQGNSCLAEELVDFWYGLCLVVLLRTFSASCSCSFDSDFGFVSDLHQSDLLVGTHQN